MAVATLEQRWEALIGSEPSPAVLEDAPELFRDLRQAAPVHRFGAAVLVTRYVDVEAVMRDFVNYSAAPGNGSMTQERRSRVAGDDLHAYDELTAFRGLFMAMQDGEDHRRIRAVAHRAFTPRRIAELGAATERYVDELLQPLLTHGVGDLADIAYRLPLMVIGDLLEVLPEDRERLYEWSRALVRHGGREDPELVRAALESARRFTEYVEAAVERWRRNPRESELVGALMAAEEEERLTSVELAAMFVQLILAGHETTSSLIGTGVYELLRDPAQWSLLCSDPSRLAAGATEELLRYVTPLQWRMRTALVDVEIAGVTVEAGTTVLALLAAANRDPEIFTDPDEIDIERHNAARHIAFGHGPHFCLGASLARLEGTLALRAVAENVPQLAVASSPVEWTSLRRLESLPVRVRARVP